MYQFEENDTFLEETINEYFKSPEYYVFNAKQEPGLGIKVCKICQFALACDLGIACISPENYNVFLEIGMVFGLGKPCIMIYNKDRLHSNDPAKVPFDISAFTNIEYSSKETLLAGLKREIPIFITKVKIYSDADKAIRENIIKRLILLPKVTLIILKEFVSEGQRGFNLSEYLKWEREKIKTLKWDYDTVQSDCHKLIGSFIGITGSVLEMGVKASRLQPLEAAEYTDFVCQRGR